MAATLDEVLDEIAAIQRRARADGDSSRPAWPMIVLRTPKGWTGPKEVDGQPVEGTWRAHQVPLAEARGQPRAPGAARGVDALLPAEELFDAEGRRCPSSPGWLRAAPGG